MTLRNTFDAHRGRYTGKIDHFYDIYENHFARFRGTAVKLLEIGVHRGGSLEMWRNYFGPDAELHGLDINPAARVEAPEDCEIHLGSQDDPEFLKQVMDEHGPFDIVIDDGSHQMDHQICSFETIYPRLAPRGLYVCEDAFTSYWREFGGAVGADHTFVEYAKRLIDELHAYWAGDDGLTPTEFTRSTAGIHFYSGTIIFERRPMEEPFYAVRTAKGLTRTSIADLKRAAAPKAD